MGAAASRRKREHCYAVTDGARAAALLSHHNPRQAAQLRRRCGGKLLHSAPPSSRQNISLLLRAASRRPSQSSGGWQQRHQHQRQRQQHSATSRADGRMPLLAGCAVAERGHARVRIHADPPCNACIEAAYLRGRTQAAWMRGLDVGRRRRRRGERCSRIGRAGRPTPTRRRRQAGGPGAGLSHRYVCSRWRRQQQSRTSSLTPRHSKGGGGWCSTGPLHIFERICLVPTHGTEGM